VNTEADAIEARLAAEGGALGAKVQGEYENKLNALLGSPAGKAYVAWQAAANVKFSDVLTFSSADGIPAVLRLRQFAEQFMGARWIGLKQRLARVIGKGCTGSQPVWISVCSPLRSVCSPSRWPHEPIRGRRATSRASA
jgi:hypothetical protein